MVNKIGKRSLNVQMVTLMMWRRTKSLWVKPMNRWSGCGWDCTTSKMCSSCRKPAANHHQRNGKGVLQTGVHLENDNEASEWPRERFPMDPSQPIWWGHHCYLQHDSKILWLSEWKETGQEESNFHSGYKESQACCIHVQNDGTLLKEWWYQTCQQHICAKVPTSVGAGTEKWHTKLTRTVEQKLWRT